MNGHEMKASKTNQNRKRAKKGSGSLYIVGKDRKRYKAGATVSGGVYYLEYWQPLDNGEKRKKRIALKHTEDIPEEEIKKGDPVTKVDHARNEQERIVTRFVLAKKEDRLAAIAAELATTNVARAKAEDEAEPPLSIADAWSAYIKSNEAPETGPDTLKNYAGQWKAFTDWLELKHPEAISLRDITANIANAYISKLRAMDYSPTTSNNHLGFIKLLFKTLDGDTSIDTRLTADPFKNAKRRNRKQNSRRELTIQEIRNVIDTAEGELKTLLLLGATTGLRLGDCCTLRWNEVDFVRRQLRRKPNKLQHRETAPTLKIGMPTELLQRLGETPPNKRKGFVLPEHAELYTHRNETGRQSKQPKIARRIQKHFEGCGIPTHREGTGPTPEFWSAYNKWLRNGKTGPQPTHPRAIIEVGFHSLRHSYVSLQAERGVPQSVVQKIVGHGSPAMTQHYTHVTDKAAADATLAFNVGIMNAEYEVLPDQPPAWVKELAEELNGDNWEEIKTKLLA